MVQKLYLNCIWNKILKTYKTKTNLANTVDIFKKLFINSNKYIIYKLKVYI